mmetsp:Transcript_36402/g.74220  ORF Transcript_36402/g.74220 Transcript_36402/m.74220 type:complete len:101 (-) Transcript_36402:3913-4215(-)
MDQQGFESPQKECDPFHSAVEIGTSNFDTVIQEMARTHPKATGLSVDAMQLYINQLPSLKCWRNLPLPWWAIPRIFLCLIRSQLFSSTQKTLLGTVCQIG